MKPYVADKFGTSRYKKDSFSKINIPYDNFKKKWCQDLMNIINTVQKIDWSTGYIFVRKGEVLLKIWTILNFQSNQRGCILTL